MYMMRNENVFFSLTEFMSSSLFKIYFHWRDLVSQYIELFSRKLKKMKKIKKIERTERIVVNFQEKKHTKYSEVRFYLAVFGQITLGVVWVRGGQNEYF